MKKDLIALVVFSLFVLAVQPVCTREGGDIVTILESDGMSTGSATRPLTGGNVESGGFGDQFQFDLFNVPTIDCAGLGENFLAAASEGTFDVVPGAEPVNTLVLTGDVSATQPLASDRFEFIASLNQAEEVSRQGDDVNYNVPASLELPGRDDGEDYMSEGMWNLLADGDGQRMTFRRGQNPPLNGNSVDNISLRVDCLTPCIDAEDPTSFILEDIRLSTGNNGRMMGNGGTLADLKTTSTSQHFVYESPDGGAVHFVCNPNGEDLSFEVIQRFTNGQIANLKVLGMLPTSTLVDLDDSGISAAALTDGPVLEPGGSPSSQAGLPEATPDRWVTLPIGASVIPHAPFGRVGDLSLTSQIVVGNPGLEPVEAVLHFLGAADGEPLSVRIDGEDSTAHAFTLPAGESRVFEVEPIGPVQVGWVTLKRLGALTAAANFVTTQGTEIIAEAGIAAADLGLRHVLNVSRTGPSDTAFAIVNVTPTTADVTLQLRDSDGMVVATEALELPSLQQRALFIGQVFDLPEGAFQGTLQVFSNASVGLLSLKTLNGLQSSSLPSATL